MFQREIRAKSQTCPDCGEKLSVERDLFLCKDHGAFFAYGPQLLVRAPHQAAKPSDAPLPWELPRTTPV
jgi:hypothetical protein